jgi:hypothetical protein
MSETRILIRLLRIYFPINWEYGSALSKFRNLGPPSVRHCLYHVSLILDHHNFNARHVSNHEYPPYNYDIAATAKQLRRVKRKSAINIPTTPMITAVRWRMQTNMFIQLATSLMTSLLSIIQTKTVKQHRDTKRCWLSSTPYITLNAWLAFFDAIYNFERLIIGHTGSAKHFVYKKTNLLSNFEGDFFFKFHRQTWHFVIITYSSLRFVCRWRCQPIVRSLKMVDTQTFGL